jgi:hypothetical protein
MHVAACCLYFMPYMKLHKVKKRTAEPKNIECRMSKDGIASGFAFGYDPTGRSLFFLKMDRIH